MSEPDNELSAAIRGLAEQLDRASSPVDPDEVRARASLDAGPSGSPVLRRRRQGALVAAVVVVLIAAGAAAVRFTGDEPDTVVAGSTTAATTTTGPSAWKGPVWSNLPTGGLAAVGPDGTVHLYGFDGTSLGSAPGSKLDPTELSGGQTSHAIAVHPDFDFAVVDPAPAAAQDGCGWASGAGGTRIAVCTVGDTTQVVRLSPTGARTVVSGPLPATLGGAPAGQVAGRWSEVHVSPNGGWLLAQWRGECEVPTAWLIPVNGGAPRLATGETGLGDGEPNSSVIGWTPDGRALITIDGPEPACGSGLPTPGTYAVDPSNLGRDLLVAKRSGVFAASLWQREVATNPQERIVNRAVAELGLEPSGEPQYVGNLALSGTTYDGAAMTITVDGDGIPDLFKGTSRSSVVLADDVPAVTGTSPDGAFLAFTCSGNTWRLGSEPDSAPTIAQLSELASNLIAHAYCTVGEPPS